MRVIPVIDLMQGQVVRGVAGNRATYRPIESGLVDGSDPVVVANALIREFGFDELYLADLDAIQGHAMAASTYAQLQACGLRMWVDAGISHVAAAAGLLDAAPVERIIVGLETLPGWGALESMLESIGPDRLVFSLDLKQGRPMSVATDWSSGNPWQIAVAAVERGVQRLIVLDLAAVGVRQGLATLELCRTIRAQCSAIELISGGGVRDVTDLKSLRDVGCDAALVATALHDGRVTPGQLQAFGSV